MLTEKYIISGEGRIEARKKGKKKEGRRKKEGRKKAGRRLNEGRKKG